MARVNPVRVLTGLALVAALTAALVIVINVTQWSVRGAKPPVVKYRGSDMGDPSLGVKSGEAYWSIVDGLNVTSVVVTVPRCHTVRYSPVLNIYTTSDVSVRIEAVSLTGTYSSSLERMVIVMGGITQVAVENGHIVQSTGEGVSIQAGASCPIELTLKVGPGAELGSEVARLETLLVYEYGPAIVKQKIVWIVRTFAVPPKVVLFSDSFEDGDLSGWQHTDYVYVERKTGIIEVQDTDHPCPPSTPSSIRDATTPVDGEWHVMIGHRDLDHEPEERLADYISVGVNVPAVIDGVEVKYVLVSLWWFMHSWDSAYYDYLDIYVSKTGGGTYYFKREYNPNPGYNYGPYANTTTWQHNSTYFTGVAGSAITLTVRLTTYWDECYKSWVYVDNVKIVVYFDCVENAEPLAVSQLSGQRTATTSTSPRPACRACQVKP